MTDYNGRLLETTNETSEKDNKVQTLQATTVNTPTDYKGQIIQIDDEEEE